MTKPHLDKLNAALNNPSIPRADIPRIQSAIVKYDQWVIDMNSLTSTGDDLIKDMVDLLNTYKKYIELDLLFKGSENYMYRQKGQLKIDNAILEEFLPLLVDPRIIPGLAGLTNVTTGPQKSYAGMFFTYANLGATGGGVDFKMKDQDFTVGRKYYVKTSNTNTFAPTETLSSEVNVAYFAAEIKTNLDKTMFQEASATARELKLTVTGAKYILMCEWLDMTPISTKTTEIDEVILLRKGKRLSSNVRSSFSTAAGRHANQALYEAHLDAHPVSLESIMRVVNHIRDVFPLNSSLDETEVLSRGYF